MSCDILRWECETQLVRLRFPTHLLPINQFNSRHLDIGQWAGGTSVQPFKMVRYYENWLKRLDAFTVWCHTAVTNMRVGIKRGWVLPKSLPVNSPPKIGSARPGTTLVCFETVRRIVLHHLAGHPLPAKGELASPAQDEQLHLASAFSVDRLTGRITLLTWCAR